MNASPSPVIPSASLLSLLDRSFGELVQHDEKQSPLARKRAAALLLLDENASSETIHRLTGMTAKSQQTLLKRLAMHDVRTVLLGVPGSDGRQLYDPHVIKQAIKGCLSERPPVGSYYWTLAELTKAIQQRVPAASLITRQSVACLLRKEMSIPSIRNLPPYWLTQTKKTRMPKDKTPLVSQPGK